MGRNGTSRCTSRKTAIDSRGWRRWRHAGQVSGVNQPRRLEVKRSRPRRTVLRKSWSAAWNSASRSSRRGMTTRSIAPVDESRTSVRNISRIRRLARFLWTAPPIFREATIPSRERSSVVLQQQEREETAVNPLAGIEDGAELPAFANPSLAGKSRRRAARPAGDVFHRRLYARLRAHRLHSLTGPGPVAARTSRPSRTCPAGPTRRKPSAACGPWRGDASGRDGHSSWPCAPGSRECGGGAGDSVETCVCPS